MSMSERKGLGWPGIRSCKGWTIYQCVSVVLEGVTRFSCDDITKDVYGVS